MRSNKSFPGRVIWQKPYSYYVNKAEYAGLSVIALRRYAFTRRYNSPNELAIVARSIPLVEDFNKADEKRIIKSCPNATVVADPFIMVCKKER